MSNSANSKNIYDYDVKREKQRQQDIDLFKEYDDDEVQAKHCNSRKSVASVLIMDVLMTHSSKYKPMTIQQIIDCLDEYPYCITMERKAVSRNLKALADVSEDLRLGIHFERGVGAWYEKSKGSMVA